MNGQFLEVVPGWFFNRGHIGWVTTTNGEVCLQYLGQFYTWKREETTASFQSEFPRYEGQLSGAIITEGEG